MNTDNRLARTRERQERQHTKLSRKWATGKATRAEMLRCLDLGRALVSSSDSGASR